MVLHFVIVAHGDNKTKVKMEVRGMVRMDAVRLLLPTNYYIQDYRTWQNYSVRAFIACNGAKRTFDRSLFQFR